MEKNQLMYRNKSLHSPRTPRHPLYQRLLSTEERWEGRGARGGGGEIRGARKSAAGVVYGTRRRKDGNTGREEEEACDRVRQEERER